jgi:hypothetical protein
MLAYPEIPFRQSKLVGKWSSTPSDLAYETLENKSLQVIKLFYLGEEITGNLEWHMNNLNRYKKTDTKGPSSAIK